MNKCDNCRHFKVDISYHKNEFKSGGQCRRQSPVLISIYKSEGAFGFKEGNTHVESMYPRTSRYEWCGEFHPKM